MLCDWTNKACEWDSSKAVVEVTRKRTVKGKESEETSYYLTSPKLMLKKWPSTFDNTCDF